MRVPTNSPNLDSWTDLYVIKKTELAMDEIRRVYGGQVKLFRKSWSYMYYEGNYDKMLKRCLEWGKEMRVTKGITAKNLKELLEDKMQSIYKWVGNVNMSHHISMRELDYMWENKNLLRGSKLTNPYKKVVLPDNDLRTENFFVWGEEAVDNFDKWFKENLKEGKIPKYVGKDLSMDRLIMSEKYRDRTSDRIRELRYTDIIKRYYKENWFDEDLKRWVCSVDSAWASNVILYLGICDDGGKMLEILRNKTNLTEDAIKWIETSKQFDTCVLVNPTLARPFTPDHFSGLTNLIGRMSSNPGPGWGFDKKKMSEDLVSGGITLKSYDNGEWSEDAFINDFESVLKECMTNSIRRDVLNLEQFIDTPELFGTTGASKGYKLKLNTGKEIRAPKNVTVWQEDFKSWWEKSIRKRNLEVGSSEKPETGKLRIIIPFPLDETVLDSFLYYYLEQIIKLDNIVLKDSNLERLKRRIKLTALTSTDLRINCYDWKHFERHYSKRLWDKFLEVCINSVENKLVSMGYREIGDEISKVGRKMRERYLHSWIVYHDDKLGEVRIENKGANLSGNKLTSLANGVINDAIHKIRDKIKERIFLMTYDTIRYGQGDDSIEAKRTFSECWVDLRLMELMGCIANKSKLKLEVGDGVFLKEKFCGQIGGGVPRSIATLTQHSPENREVSSGITKARETSVKLHTVWRRSRCNYNKLRWIMEKTCERLKIPAVLMGIPVSLGGLGFDILSWRDSRLYYLTKPETAEPDLRLRPRISRKEEEIKGILRLSDNEFETYKKKQSEQQSSSVEDDEVIKGLRSRMKESSRIAGSRQIGTNSEIKVMKNIAVSACKKMLDRDWYKFDDYELRKGLKWQK